MENGENLSHNEGLVRKKEIIPTEKVNRVVDSLGSNLIIPKDRLETAKKSQVFLVDKDTFYETVTENIKQLGFKVPEELEVSSEDEDKAEAVFTALGTSTEEVREKRRKLVEEFYKEYSMTRGISICNRDGKKVILINQDEVEEEKMDDVLGHELLHSMVDTPDKGSGFNTEYGRYHFLNEATVQLMTLRAKYCDMEWQKFADAVKNGEIENMAYGNQVNTLLILLEATTFGKEAYTFEQLKDLYFDQEMDSGTKANFLKISLFKKIPEKIGDNENMRDKLLDIFETRLEKVVEPKKAARN